MQDLINIIQNFDYQTKYEYNIDLKSLHIIKNDLIDLNNWGLNVPPAFEGDLDLDTERADKNELKKLASKATTSTVLQIINDSTIKSNGLLPTITPVDPSREVARQEMSFDGTASFMKFDTEKTRLLEFTAKGLADGFFANDSTPLSAENIQVYSQVLGESTISGAVEYLSSLEGDNSLFTYAVTKALSTGLTLSAVYNSASTEEYRELMLAEIAAESISQAISSQIIISSIAQQNGHLLHRLAESASFGSAMGAQMASVLDKSWEFEDGWELYNRNNLAKATSKGSAYGAINAASQYIENDPTVEDTNDKTSRREILDIASGSALGSLIGNTGLAVYYPTLLQPIINQSAQGATTGGITAKNLSLIDKPKGVRGRSSENSFVKDKIGWNTKTKLKEGLKKTYTWIYKEIHPYVHAANENARVKLPNIRKGEFEGMKDKIKEEKWKPDYGKASIHPTFGVIGVGARIPLIAYNIDLATTDTKKTGFIAKAIRFSNGGFRFVQAGPVFLESRGHTQVTMNILDYKKNPIYRILETVKMEASRYHIAVPTCELVGLIPKEALLKTIKYYFQVQGKTFNPDMSLDEITKYSIEYIGFRDFDKSKIIEANI